EIRQPAQIPLSQSRRLLPPQLRLRLTRQQPAPLRLEAALLPSLPSHPPLPPRLLLSPIMLAPSVQSTPFSKHTMSIDPTTRLVTSHGPITWLILLPRSPQVVFT